jgi:hypothetical protein
MEAWLIILITISTGLVFFGSVLYCKSRKNKRPQNGVVMSQPVVVVSNGLQNSFIPSTNHSTVYNARDTSVILAHTNRVPQQQMYLGSQQQFYQPQQAPHHYVQQNQQYVQQNQQFQPNMMQNQQLYPATAHKVMVQPTAPVFT